MSESERSVEERRDVFGVHVVEEVGVHVGVESVRQRRRAERAAADADGEHRFRVGERFDCGSNFVRVGRLREVQRRVAVFVVRASGFDSLVGVGDAFVQPGECVT